MFHKDALKHITLKRKKKQTDFLHFSFKPPQRHRYKSGSALKTCLVGSSSLRNSLPIIQAIGRKLNDTAVVILSHIKRMSSRVFSHHFTCVVSLSCRCFGRSSLSGFIFSSQQPADEASPPKLYSMKNQHRGNCRYIRI